MKLTWFGGTAVRIHIGGRILVGDPGAAVGADPAELLSGSDGSFALAAESESALPVAAVDWRPRSAPTPLAGEAIADPVRVWRLGTAVLVDAVGEPPLLLLTGAPPPAGRWGRDAIVVAFGSAEVAATALASLTPRLIALAIPDAMLDAAFTALSPRLDGTALVALGPGLALEV